MNNYGSLWSVLTAEQMGYMDEQGITLELSTFADGPTIISAMESGSIDIGYIGDGAHKLCAAGQRRDNRPQPHLQRRRRHRRPERHQP